MLITIYSTTSCPFCQNLKEYLSSKSIAFVEKLIDQDEVNKKEMQTISDGFMGVPFTVVTKDDGSQIKIVGFDKGKLNQVLGIQE